MLSLSLGFRVVQGTYVYVQGRSSITVEVCRCMGLCVKTLVLISQFWIVKDSCFIVCVHIPSVVQALALLCVYCVVEHGSAVYCFV